MTPEEFQARVDKAFETLPTPEAVIEWAKEHNFTFECGSLGDASCGCALTAVALMGYPEVFEDGRTVIKWDKPDYYNRSDVVQTCIYRDLEHRSELRPIRTGIWRGFDDLSFRESESNQAAYEFGQKLHELAKENGLLKKGN